MSDALEQRRTLPPGGETEMRDMADGWRLRTMLWPAGPRGSILFLGGRGDFIEKYSEALHDWRARGYGLAAFDWRGQGGSGRLLADPLRGHTDSFAPWLADLAAQVAWFKATLPPPHYAVAHSMGGHLLLRHLEARPADFARAVLLAPMLGIRAAPLGARATRRLAALACALGQARTYPPGGGVLVRGVPGSPRQRNLTSDAERYGDEDWWLAQQPALTLGGVTWGWLHAAFASLDTLFAPGALERVTTPLLILTAEREALVDNDATARAAARLPNVTLATVAGGAHELLREADVIRRPVLDRIAAVLA